MSLPLFDGLDAMPAPGLTCAFGEPWGIGTKHPLCEQLANEGIAEFQTDVAAGIYDAEGYTPAERRAQQRRKRAP